VPVIWFILYLIRGSDFSMPTKFSCNFFIMKNKYELNRSSVPGHSPLSSFQDTQRYGELLISPSALPLSQQKSEDYNSVQCSSRVKVGVYIGPIQRVCTLFSVSMCRFSICLVESINVSVCEGESVNRTQTEVKHL
jgi:hypothetical protein